jgi:hypothetical protein
MSDTLEGSFLFYDSSKLQYLHFLSLHQILAVVKKTSTVYRVIDSIESFFSLMSILFYLCLNIRHFIGYGYSPKCVTLNVLIYMSAVLTNNKT